jgi:Tfp pilus assembly protein PilP
MRYDEAVDMAPLLKKQEDLQKQIAQITQQAQARLAPLQVQLNTLAKQIGAAQKKAPNQQNQPQQPAQSNQPGQQQTQQSPGLNPVSPVA